MVKRLLIELEDKETSNTPHYLEQLGEELSRLKLEVISIKEVDLSVETGTRDGNLDRKRGDTSK